MKTVIAITVEFVLAYLSFHYSTTQSGDDFSAGIQFYLLLAAFSLGNIIWILILTFK